MTGRAVWIGLEVITLLFTHHDPEVLARAAHRDVERSGDRVVRLAALVDIRLRKALENDSGQSARPL